MTLSRELELGDEEKVMKDSKAGASSRITMSPQCFAEIEIQVP